MCFGYCTKCFRNATQWAFGRAIHPDAANSSSAAREGGESGCYRVGSKERICAIGELRVTHELDPARRVVRFDTANSSSAVRGEGELGRCRDGGRGSARYLQQVALLVRSVS